MDSGDTIESPITLESLYTMLLIESNERLYTIGSSNLTKWIFYLHSATIIPESGYLSSGNGTGLAPSFPRTDPAPASNQSESTGSGR